MKAGTEPRRPVIIALYPFAAVIGVRQAQRLGRAGRAPTLRAAPRARAPESRRRGPGKSVGCNVRVMSDQAQSPTTRSRTLASRCSPVSDQDAALAFYTDKLGFEVRSDVPFGENDEFRWLEVAPPGSTARLALNPPMNDQPGGSSDRRRVA